MSETADAAYRLLLANVDAFLARAEPAQAQWLRCGRGCDACCRTQRTAWAVELNAISLHLQSLPESTRDRLSTQAQDPEVVAGRRCAFLEVDGACAIYPSRPLICRAHGPAVRLDAALRWCALNFEGLSASQVAASVQPDTTLDLDRVDALLALANRAYLATDAGRGRPLRGPLQLALEWT